MARQAQGRRPVEPWAGTLEVGAQPSSAEGDTASEVCSRTQTPSPTTNRSLRSSAPSGTAHTPIPADTPTPTHSQFQRTPQTWRTSSSGSLISTQRFFLSSQTICTAQRAETLSGRGAPGPARRGSPGSGTRCAGNPPRAPTASKRRVLQGHPPRHSPTCSCHLASKPRSSSSRGASGRTRTRHSEHKHREDSPEDVVLQAATQKGRSSGSQQQADTDGPTVPFLHAGTRLPCRCSCGTTKPVLLGCWEGHCTPRDTEWQYVLRLDRAARVLGTCPRAASALTSTDTDWGGGSHG